MKNQTTYNQSKTDFFGEYALILVIGMVGPFVLWGLQQFVALPVVSEELYRFLVAWWLWASTRSASLTFRGLILLGVVFGISESMMYVLNVVAFGSLDRLAWRMILTVPMHVLAAMLQGFGWRWGGLGGVVGLGLAMGWHAFFNALI